MPVPVTALSRTEPDSRPPARALAGFPIFRAMRRPGNIATVLTLLLAVLLGGETTDLLPCGEETCSAWLVLLNPNTAEGSGEDDHPNPTASAEALACCLCHVSFSPAAAQPIPQLAELPLAGSSYLTAVAVTALVPVPTPPPRG